MNRSRWIGSFVLLAALLGTGAALATWKRAAAAEQDALAASQPEPQEAVVVATAIERDHRPTTTAIGTVVALRSITLRNELPGTVRQVALEPGAVVEEGALLAALDVAVEEAELRAQEAQLALAGTLLGRLERARAQRGASELDVDRARSERDVAEAQVARTRAIIDRKTIRAPFRARVGMVDLHVGQYLDAGTLLTTLQGVDAAVHVDFEVAQDVAATLHEGEQVEVAASGAAPPVDATVVAVDALVDAVTRNAKVRVLVADGARVPGPGASVRVRVPTAPASRLVAIPVSALRKGPDGDHVFVVAPDERGQPRAHLRGVVAGAAIGDLVLIRDGLAVGETVAASGSFKLREGAAVATAAAAASEAAR